LWQRLSTFLFGEKIGDKLPERVGAAIEQRQHESERLIGWVQLLLVSFFATLFAVAPPPAEMAPYQLEPWTVGTCFVFTLVRLACAYRNYLPA
jgi:adenylate cyclase